MQIVLAADARFIMPLGVTLTSLALTHSPDELTVTVLHDGVSETDMAQVEQGPAGHIDLTWRQIDMSMLQGTHHMACLTDATKFRLLPPSVMPKSVKRAIYLDCDVVVAGSLRPLWDLDLDGHLVAAVRDAGAPFPAGPYGTQWRELGLTPDSPYFNAGVLVIPLEEWRIEEVSRRALDILRRSKPRWGDQDALNAVMERRWMELDRRWNLQTPDSDGSGLAWALWRDNVERALADPAVVHYTERDKPWRPGCRHPLASRWYEALDESPWSGWRPSRSFRPLHRRAAAKVKRAGQRLKADWSRATT
jgi:lipopolysaccharide biosynthesis glycosyltransferase